MNINLNRITDTWQKLDNPCDYLTFAVTLFCYTITLGNWDCFPRAQQASNDYNSPQHLFVPIEERTVIQPETIENAIKCIDVMDKKDIQTAGNLLKDSFSNLPQIQKDEIRRAFGICLLDGFTDNMNKVKVLRALSIIQTNHTDAGTYIQDAFHLLSDSQLMIIRCTLANFRDNNCKKLE